MPTTSETLGFGLRRVVGVVFGGGDGWQCTLHQTIAQPTNQGQATSWVSSFGFLCLLAWLGGCSLTSSRRKRNGGAVQPGPFPLLRSGSRGVGPPRSPHHAPPRRAGNQNRTWSGTPVSRCFHARPESLCFWLCCLPARSDSFRLGSIPCETEKDLQQFRNVMSKGKAKRKRERNKRLCSVVFVTVAIGLTFACQCGFFDRTSTHRLIPRPKCSPMGSPLKMKSRIIRP